MALAQAVPAQRYFTSQVGGAHRIAFYEWGDADNPSVVLCMHGLSRNGRDFNALARHLSSRHRVICPDAPGRGASDSLTDLTRYAYPVLAEEIVGLLRHLHIARVAWVGTSMGGILGMLVAPSHSGLISRMVLNDVGAEVDPAGVRRILGYVGKLHSFANRREAMTYLRITYAPFGIESDAQWDTVYDATFVENNGEVTFAYDPAIVKPVAAPRDPAALAGPAHYWSEWNRIACPVLILRGENSDLLSKETVHRMCERPGTQTMEVPRCGHAPALLNDQQIGIVDTFLSET